jgi:hypothetical protein
MDDELPRTGERMSRFADVVDRTLECAVVPSFTRIGSDVRSRLDHWTPISRFDLTGRVVVITGATSGLGLSAAADFLARGATVEIIGRDAAKTAAVCERLRSVLGPLLRNPERGVDTLVWLAADGPPLYTTGLLWLDRGPRLIHRLSSTRRSDTAEERGRLWDWCIKDAGIHP